MPDIKAACEKHFPRANQEECKNYFDNYMEMCNPSKTNPRGGCQNASEYYTCSEQDCFDEAISKYTEKYQSHLNSLPEISYISLVAEEEISKLSQAVLASDWDLLKNHLTELKANLSNVNKLYKEMVANYLRKLSDKKYGIPGPIKEETKSTADLLYPKSEDIPETTNATAAFSLDILFNHGLGSDKHHFKFWNQETDNEYTKELSLRNFDFLLEGYFGSSSSNGMGWQIGGYLGLLLGLEYVGDDAVPNIEPRSGLRFGYRFIEGFEIDGSLGLGVLFKGASTSITSWGVEGDSGLAGVRYIVGLKLLYYITENDAILANLQYIDFLVGDHGSLFVLEKEDDVYLKDVRFYRDDDKSSERIPVYLGLGYRRRF